MAVFPQKPRTGQKVLQGLYNSVCQIIDYLPSLEVRGDNSSTAVTKTSNGTIIHSTNNNSTLSQKKNYYGFHGISIEGNRYIACTLTGGNYITVNYYEQDHQNEGDYLLTFPTINCNLSGGRYIQITSAGVINYTGPSGGGGGGQEYYDGRFIKISSDFSINCTLSALTELYNDPLVYDFNAYPVATGYPYHFMQLKDFFDYDGGSYSNGHEGAGTKISYHYYSTGQHDQEGSGPDHLIRVIDGIEVDLTVSGGQYITTNFHKGVGHGDYSSASIDCNLYGTYDWYPHTSGFIAIVPLEDYDGNVTGGIISTNLHAGNGISIDDRTGEISVTGGTGGNVPTPTPNTILSANSQNQMVWTANTGGGGGGTGQDVCYIFSSGIYQATSGSKWVVRYPHIPIAWSDSEENPPWPEGWQPPKEPGMDEYISMQWPLYQYYYNQPADPPLPCGYLCSTYRWGEGDYGGATGHWDILIKLPSVTERTIVEVINYGYTALAVVTENGKQIIPQSFNNTVGNTQHQYAIQYPNTLFSFFDVGYTATLKIVFYYDPAPPTGVERNPYSTDAVQLFSGGCWFAQMFCD